MIEIELTDEVAKLAREQSEAAGFGDNLTAFIEHLLLVQHSAAVGAVPSPRTHEELIELLDESSASGRSLVSFEDQMKSFRAQMAARTEQ